MPILIRYWILDQRSRLCNSKGRDYVKHCNACKFFHFSSSNRTSWSYFLHLWDDHVCACIIITTWVVTNAFYEKVPNSNCYEWTSYAHWTYLQNLLIYTVTHTMLLEFELENLAKRKIIPFIVNIFIDKIWNLNEHTLSML